MHGLLHVFMYGMTWYAVVWYGMVWSARIVVHVCIYAYMYGM